jgi:hypothetical protein
MYWALAEVASKQISSRKGVEREIRGIVELRDMARGLPDWDNLEMDPV